MISQDIICSRCGWRNEPTARMCGGCGMPLTTNSNGLITAEATPTSLNLQTPVTPASDIGATTPATPLPLPADVAPRDSRHTAPIPATPVYRTSAPAALTTAAPRGTSRNRGGNWALSLLIALVLLLILSAIGYSSWGLFIQPGIQTQVDAELNTRIDSMLRTAIPTQPGSASVSAVALNSTLAAQPQDSAGWVRNLRVQIYANNEAVFTFRFLMRDGIITTHLEAVNGRLMVYGTVVDGELSAFETGTQVEAAFNRGFSLLPATARYTGITSVP
ncbi:MAG: hypothetical protein ABI068_04455, partial [Ktedonobacterales bacterium]